MEPLEINEKGVVSYDITDAAISQMREKYMALELTDLTDKEAYSVVCFARKEVKGKRIAVEKRRVELKKDALSWGKLVDSSAKHIFEQLKPIEEHLQAEEDKVKLEKQRIEDEKQAQERERVAGIQGRMENMKSMAVIEPTINAVDIQDVLKIFIDNKPDDLYAEYQEEATAVWEACKAKVSVALDARVKWEEGEAERKKEEIRLTEQKVEQEAEAEKNRKEREEFEKEKAALATEKAKIEAEKAAEAKRIAAKQVEENAKAKAIQDAKDKEEADRVKAEKEKALRPDKEKLLAYFDLLQSVPEPELGKEIARSLGWFSSEFIELIDKVKEAL